jgi:hypothetical protein
MDASNQFHDLAGLTPWKDETVDPGRRSERYGGEKNILPLPVIAQPISL